MATKRGNGEGTIGQGKDGRWVARLTLANGKRKALYGRTRAEVAKKLAAAIRDKDRNVLPADDRLTVRSYLLHWIEHGTRNVQPSTRYGYESHVRVHLVPRLGSTRLSQLSPRHVERLVSDLNAEGVHPTTISRIRATLRLALGQAVAHGIIQRNVAAGHLIKVPRAERKPVRVPSAAEARTLLAAFVGHPLEAAVTVSLACGLRQGELRALRWEDVDLDAGMLTVCRAMQRDGKGWRVAAPKTSGSLATIPIPSAVVASLRHHKAMQARQRLAAGGTWPLEDYVFTSSTGTPLDPSNLLRTYRAQLAAAGLPRMSWHELRHACGSLLLARGVDIVTVSRILRHASVTTTLRIYAHVLPGGMELAAQRMDELLTGSD